MPTNELYFVVLPMIHLDSGLTEQTLTLLPDIRLATEFDANEVQGYIDVFEWRAKKYLTGGNVQKYEIKKESTEEGKFIVRVIQHVT